MNFSLVDTLGGYLPPQNISLISQVHPPPAFTQLKPSLIEGLPDGILALIAPVVAYWGYSTFFHIIDVYELAEKYRIHPSEEELSRNKVTLKQVVYDVILQHIIQTVVGYVVYRIDPPSTIGHELNLMWHIRQWLPLFVPNVVVWFMYTYLWPTFRLVAAICIIDTWQYWLHRYMHTNKTLYKRFHSRHHRLYVPYAYGALYNDPVEGFLLDTLGTGVAGIITQLSARESIFLYTFATMKTVDDHCGYRLPYDLFQIIFPNNSVYHDIHHQIWGIKHNFSQPFFTIWDRMFKTEYEFVEEYRNEQHQITLEKYKLFLKNRKAAKSKNPKIGLEASTSVEDIQDMEESTSEDTIEFEEKKDI